MKILNLRDVSVTSSDKIKKNLIYRSAHPDWLNDAEIESIGVRTIIDLRGPSERKNARQFKNVKTVHLPIDFEERIWAQVKTIRKKEDMADQLSAILATEYIGLVESQKGLIKQIFALLGCGESYPVLIHCRAGKDRTGFVVAIIKMALGVSYPDIVHDYLLSNKYYLPAALKKLRMMKVASFGMINTKKYEYLLTSHKLNIERVIDTIRYEYGTVENYLDSCGVSHDILSSVKSILQQTRG